MSRIILACAVAVLALHVAGCAQTYDISAWDCGLLKENPTNLGVGEAVRRATKRVMPVLLGDEKTMDARVTVAVAVDAHGSVQCVHAKEGHPLFIGACTEAAKDWKFRPYTVKGHSVPFVPDLTFHFTGQKVRLE
jgi:hypothetical protein